MPRSEVMLALSPQLADLDENSPEAGKEMLAQMTGQTDAVDITDGVDPLMSSAAGGAY